MVISAIALFIIGTALTLGLRTWVQWKRTRDTGHRHDPAPRFSAQWWSHQLVLLNNFLVAAGPIAALFGLSSLPSLDHTALNVSGVVITVAALAFTVAAQFHMGDSWRVGVDREEHTSLVVGGFFACVRNPIFVGFAAGSAGMALMVPNIFSLAGFVSSVVSVQVTVRLVEEPYLVAMHGEEYIRYADKVGRFVPGVGRLRHADDRYTSGRQVSTES
ncbi:isoprenylcysteine carboxylmethyltransferase family protein [Streptomyces sp. RG80]|uniref:methyltransferase family protein n=1 Tax=Streptomyces sp. RG80 TaxID=3157340 RepID=UPI00338FA0F6